MISYKVLITLTMAYYITCSGCDSKETTELDKQVGLVSSCLQNLEEAGFTNKLGIVNFCFIKQFLDLKKNATSLYYKEPSDDVIDYFKYNELLLDMANLLITPKEFCTNRFYKRPGFFSRLFCDIAKQSIIECTNEILSSNVKGLITTIQRENETIQIMNISARSLSQKKRNEITIGYGNDVCKNAIQTNILNTEFKPKEYWSTKLWEDSRKQYFWKQLKAFKKSQKYYRSAYDWCKEKHIPKSTSTKGKGK